MLRPLRGQLQELMADIPVMRRPALRRCDAPDALLATDLPLIAGEDAVQAFMLAARAAGWRMYALPNGWLALDHDVPVPAVEDDVNVPGEAGCCLSLLRRHPGGAAESEMLRALVRADEAGKSQLERLLSAWHRDFAARLREHRALPGGLVPYLCKAMEHHWMKEEGQ